MEAPPQLRGKEGGWAGGWRPGPCPPPIGVPLTPIPGEVEAEDVGAVGAEVVQPPQVGLQLPARQLGLQQQRQVAEHKSVQGGGAETERGRGGGWRPGLGGAEGAAGATSGAEEDAPLDLVRGGLPRWRQPGPDWDSIPGLHKGHIECPTAPQAPPVPGSPPAPLHHWGGSSPTHTAPLSPDPGSVPRTSRPEPEPTPGPAAASEPTSPSKPPHCPGVTLTHLQRRISESPGAGTGGSGTPGPLGTAAGGTQVGLRLRAPHRLPSGAVPLLAVSLGAPLIQQPPVPEVPPSPARPHSQASAPHRAAAAAAPCAAAACGRVGRS